MKFSHQKAVGWIFIVLGAIIVACRQQIVFPGLERLLGIENIVGRDSVVYQPDGSYVFTNPAAMIRWITGVAATGSVIALFGAVLLFKARRRSNPAA